MAYDRAVVGEGSEFDLLAASLRAESRDVEAFVEALAAKLEGAFPERVRVERKGGHLGGRRRVERVTLELDEHSFELEREHAQVNCRRRNVVRGIVLKNVTLPLEQWIDELSEALARTAGETERGRQALQRLLES